LQLEVFSSPGYVLFYLLAMSVIFFHLWHGLSSAAQSLGVSHSAWTPGVLIAGRVLAVAIAGGFFLIPIYTFLLARGVL
jgi:succinate dehydrogenase / fumarate reductase cytochrome b subunit